MPTLDIIDQHQLLQLVIYTDSKLICNMITSWITTWKKNNWIKADGRTKVANLDLVKKLDILMSTRSIIMRHVKAHTTKTDWESNNNRLADKLATDKLDASS